MHISTSLLPQPNLNATDTDIAIVIDILRASSVITTSLANGANQVITTSQVDEARALACELPQKPLLCGERGCVVIEGFDLGNSPADYRAEVVTRQDLVLTTTNGTQAIEVASAAKEVWIGSFLNLSVIVRSVPCNARIAFICAGTDGSITMEDVLFAGAAVTQLEKRYSAQVDDGSRIAKQLWQSWFGPDRLPNPKELAEKLNESRGGRNLIRLGYEADIQWCAKIDSAPIVPVRMQKSPTSFRCKMPDNRLEM
ncbi:putative 2-phosphosulfolactate phosphatase [Planctomycetes bacterium CA13]|uniref:Probable 2-phosphosulfolactate phosphatase n=1 Tax=Novipirellula herctigrandis TaxID=2527986 RepID=A0A5C5Z9E8_9BACT|nr:putative 2-phosphosulfolactate phosphatase [Planctomycetes bacterium CA13]